MNVSFAYALARLHARLALRPGAGERARLAALLDFGHFLQAAAHGGFGPWLKHLGPASTPHQIELALRRQYRAYLQQVASWLPGGWQEPVRWLGLAPDLAVFGHLAAGRENYPWMDYDSRYAAWAAAIREPERNAPMAPPALAGKTGAAVARAWLRQGVALLPAVETAARRQLEGLLQDHLEAANRELESRLMRTFRRRRHEAVRLFAVLGLARFDFDHLRGELLTRMLPRRQAA